CDKCIWDLIDDLRISDLLINETRSTIRNISTGVAVNRLLSDINSSVILFTENLQEKKNQSLFEDLQISNIETEVELIQAEVNEITEKGNLAEMKGQLIHKETMETMSRAKLTAEQVSDIEDEINETLVKLKHYESLQGDVSPTDRVKNLKDAEQMLKKLSVLNFDTQNKLVQEEAEIAEDLLSEVQDDWVQKHNNTLSLFPIVLEPIAEYNKKLSDLQEFIKEARNSTMQSTDKNTENSGKLHMQDNMSGHHAEIDGANNELQERIANLSDSAEDLVRQAVDHALVLQRQADGLKR
ncbi:hypothetical protein AB205_0117620, partial [Aquarana catesbeiana]